MTTSTPSDSNLPPGASPLNEVSETSLNLLFSTVPDELSDAELDRIVSALEVDRERFLTAEATEKAKPKKVAKVAAPLDMKIEDLDL